MRIFFAAASIAIAAVASSAAATSCDGFTDVDSANTTYCSAVTYLKDTGITLGCTGTTYCPNDDVTRLQMALFLQRMANNAVFKQGGNAFGATAVLGTNDNYAVTFLANGSRVMAYQPNANSPNLIGGFSGNAADNSDFGQTIGGGGLAGTDCYNAVDQMYEKPCANTTTGGNFATISGGFANTASGSGASVGGGESNSATQLATVSGGVGNLATGLTSVVGGGSANTSSGVNSSVLGGAGNMASGDYSAVPGGSYNMAAGTHSFAAGTNAHANNVGCFVWADDSSGSGFDCNTNNAFYARAAGGFNLYSNSSAATGVQLAAGSGSWTSLSDRAAKAHISTVDPQAILASVVAMPVSTWNYNAQDAAIRHIGPMAQDFYAAFGLGETDKGISTVDAQGVALAAIQGLNEKLDDQLQKKDARIAALEHAVTRMQARMDALTQ